MAVHAKNRRPGWPHCTLNYLIQLIPVPGKRPAELKLDAVENVIIEY